MTGEDAHLPAPLAPGPDNRTVGLWFDAMVAIANRSRTVRAQTNVIRPRPFSQGESRQYPPHLSSGRASEANSLTGWGTPPWRPSQGLVSHPKPEILACRNPQPTPCSRLCLLTYYVTICGFSATVRAPPIGFAGAQLLSELALIPIEQLEKTQLGLRLTLHHTIGSQTDTVTTPAL